MQLALLAIAMRSYSVAHESPFRFSQVQTPPFRFFKAGPIELGPLPVGPFVLLCRQIGVQIRVLREKWN